MTLQNWVLWGAVAVVGAVALYGASHPKAVIDATKVDVNAIAQAVLQKVQGNLGAVSGPDSSFPCESHNGVTTCFAQQKLRQATTTVCAFKSPAATSTLMTGSGVKFSVSSSSAITVNLAKAATPFATTTSLGVAALAAGAQGTFSASTTPNGLPAGNTIVDNAWVFAPNTFFVVGVQAGVTSGDTAGTGFVPEGSCSVIWKVM
jgi:hypothetical protein